MIWGCCGLYWLVNIAYFDDDKENFRNYVDPNKRILKNVLASVILDIVLAGSEIFHKILHHIRSKDESQFEQENPQTGIELQENI